MGITIMSSKLDRYIKKLYDEIDGGFITNGEIVSCDDRDVGRGCEAKHKINLYELTGTKYGSDGRELKSGILSNTEANDENSITLEQFKEGFKKVKDTWI